MVQPEQYEQIELYLLGKRSGLDLQAFEQRLASEPDFEKEVSLQREVFDAIRLEGKADAFAFGWKALKKNGPGCSCPTHRSHSPLAGAGGGAGTIGSSRLVVIK
ncbi:MAG: hypothetical protein IPM82_29825 [Saprospiraceae bacterium]|nr:hypothetical protein [Saprospiraceae bacterium]